MRIYKKLKLGIVGHGFVGKATDWGFNKRISKYIVDPLLDTDVSDLKDFEPEIVFICVPTPMGDDGSQDSSIIEEVVKELILYCPNAIKVVKSTVLPSLLDKLHGHLPHHRLHFIVHQLPAIPFEILAVFVISQFDELLNDLCL